MHKQQSLVRTAELTVLSARAHAHDHALLIVFMVVKDTGAAVENAADDSKTNEATVTAITPASVSPTTHPSTQHRISILLLMCRHIQRIHKRQLGAGILPRVSRVLSLFVPLGARYYVWMCAQADRLSIVCSPNLLFLAEGNNL